MIRRIIDPESIGSPQFIAAALLLVYLLQCAWFIRVQTLHGVLPDSDHALCIYDGLEQWKGGAIAGTPEALRAEAVTGMPSAGRAGHLRVRDGYDVDRSPLYYLVAGAPVLVQPVDCLPTRRSVKSWTIRHTCFSASCWEARSGTSHGVSTEMPADISHSCSIAFHPP